MNQSFESLLVRQCAPTLAGLKAGSLFCAAGQDLRCVRRSAALWDRRLRRLGLSVRVLLERPQAGHAIVYVYRVSQLRQALLDPDCLEFLHRAGYVGGCLEQLLEQLTRRLRTQADFPHEIGVFLGYPLRDVIGFIENRGQNFTCCGLWKSYGDPETVQRCFSRCRSCVDHYVRMYQLGTPIEKLAVCA